MGTTPVNGWSTPELTDVPNIVTATSFVTSVDQRVNPIFANTTARDTAIPTPTQGQECYVTATGEKYIYNGSSWVGLAGRRNILTSNQVQTDATAYGGIGPQLAVEASSQYMVRGWCWFQSQGTATNDMAFALLGPSGCGGWYSLDSSVTANAIQAVTVAAGFTVDTDSATFRGLWFYGYMTTTNSGTLQVRFSENTAVGGVTSVTMYTGSWLELVKTV